MSIQTIDPATGQLVQSYTQHSPAEVSGVLDAASEAYRSWRTTDIETRIAPFRSLVRLLREREESLAGLMATEMGKPLREGRAEVQKCALMCEYYANEAAGLLAPEVVATDASKSYVTFQPLGPVLCIMPWNFPLWQVLRFSVPALMAGNVAVLKHAPSTTGCSFGLEELYRDAGFPDNVFRSIVLENDRVADVIADPRIAAVTFTGSTRAGRIVASQAGAALKKAVLELGGSDPYLVLEDADLESAVEAIATSRLINCGQSCIAAKRLVVVDAVREEFERRLVERMSSVKTGDPIDANTDIGPLARLDLRDNLHRQVSESVAAGARLLLGGDLPDGPGAFYPATVLTDVRAGMPAFDEELFGPAAAILPVADEAEGIAVANSTSYGLGAAVFTQDVDRGERIAALQLEAGSCFVNDFVRSDPRLPFGGIKQSGYGRELSGFGIREFVNIKTVYVD
jgi:succinate-semialdehyde dehydrogenase/glutarate-semialdehyde dehydrogenase